MTGKDLADVIAKDTPVRDAAIFGMHGAHVNITDGRYVYMRAPLPPFNLARHPRAWGFWHNLRGIVG